MDGRLGCLSALEHEWVLVIELLRCVIAPSSPLHGREDNKHVCTSNKIGLGRR